MLQRAGVATSAELLLTRMPREVEMAQSEPP